MAGTHSLWSPSSAKRWRKCAGSVVMNEGCDRPSKEAAEGTTYHKVSELVLSSKAPSCSHYVGAVMEADGFEFRVNQDDADYAQEYVNRIRERIADGCIVSIELRTDTSDTLGIPGQSGTTDCRIFDIPNETIEIRDLKFGRGVKVYAREPDGSPSDQLFIYGWSELKRTLYMCDWKWLRLCIDQPRIGHFDSITLSREECKEIAHQLWLDAQASYGAWQLYHEDATGLEVRLKPSLEGCRWCARAGSCAVRARQMRTWFPSKDEIRHMVEIPLSAKNLPLLSGPDLAVCLDRVEEMETWIRAVRAEALSRAEQKSPDAAPGWKVVEGRKGDRTADPIALITRIKSAMHQFSSAASDTLPKELYTEPELKSVAQLERSCKKLGDLGKAIWSAIVGDPEKGIPSLITQASGRPSLVRDFDARPELAPQPVSFDLRPVGEEFAKPDAAAGLL